MNRWIAVVLFLLPALGLRAQTSAPLTDYDITHYGVSLDFSDEHDTIYMAILLRYRLLNPACREIALDLVGPNPKTGKGMQVTSLTCSSMGAGLSDLPYRQTANKVYIPAQTDTAKQWFYLMYKGIPANGLIIGKNKFGERTLFSDNWPDRAAYWLACVNHPADKASFSWNVETPARYTVTCNGELHSEIHAPDNRIMWTFWQTEPIPVKVAAVGIARFDRMLDTTINCVPVYKYYYPETAYNKFYKFDKAPGILLFYNKLIGEYPFSKLANVQSTTMFGGMENAGNIFYDEERVDDYNDNIEALLAHEIAHQWFGNSVTEKSYAHLWLSEGMATFLTHYYIEKKYGTDSARKRRLADWQRSVDYSRAANRSVVDTTSNYMSLLNANSYEKGGLFLQALREQTGDSVFFKILRSFYQHYKYKNADTDDFRTEVEAITRKNWKAFFTDWLYTPRLPAKYGPPVIR